MNTLEDQVAEEQAAFEAAADGPNVDPRRQNVETEEPETVQNDDGPDGNPDEEKPAGQDPDAGKLFDVPRVQIAIDESDPSVLKVAFSGQVELERGKADEVAFYNRLHEGNGADLQIHVHVSGAKTTHRRDSDGNVDAVVATKSLIVTDVSLG